MAKHTDATFISEAVPALNAAAVPDREYRSLGSCVLDIAKALQGDKPGTYRDPAVQADFELWQSDREAWLAKRKRGNA